jgi:DNA polymerase-3 subunit gamma/tau
MSSLYQKYRSQTFAEILTQKHVVDILQSSVKNRSFGHAYLFVGTRGSGKTSLARIFARAINCQNEDFVNKNGEPCNECESCTLAISGSHTDIIEMDAASNRGIDEVRNLKEAVDFLPTIGKYKVYIIDEAHMMTKEAFNALLKTIEEPPKHVIFIMCTTELFKVLPTIISRSQVFELKHASIDEIVSKIDLILSKEGLEIDLPGKRLIAKLGKGSFRDTESILEKVINSSTSKDLKIEEVTDILGLSSIVLIDKVKEGIYGVDISKVQSILEDELDEGAISNFNYQLAESIYADIVDSLSGENKNALQFEAFDFLVSVDKDLKNTTSPKLLYIAKILNFLKKYTDIPAVAMHSVGAQNFESAPQQSKTDQDPVTDIVPAPEQDISKIKHNPAALLRQRTQAAQKTTAAPKVVEQHQETVDKPAFISKFDLLDFLKTKNTFLYRFFSSHNFEIQEGKIIIDAKRPMEKALLGKPQTVELINTFASEHGTVLKIDFGDVSAVSAQEDKKKNVEDLSEEEAKNIFK